jgi:hypothetical protein
MEEFKFCFKLQGKHQKILSRKIDGSDLSLKKVSLTVTHVRLEQRTQAKKKKKIRFGTKVCL